MDLFLKNKKGFVVGSGSYSQKFHIKGIGTAIAENFAAEKIKQIIFSYNSSDKDASKRGKIPLRRITESSEIADIVTFVSSPRNSYITGTSILIDGGASLTYK